MNRPAHLGEVVLTLRATRRLRVQETFRFDWFGNEGDETFSQLTFVRRPIRTLTLYQTPAARPAFRLGRRLDWNVDKLEAPRFNLQAGRAALSFY